MSAAILGFTIALFTLVEQGVSIRCFDCQSVPLPLACSRVVDRSSEQYCFTELVVTDSGQVVYNLGCRSNTGCSGTSVSLVGKRAVNSTTLVADIPTCTECCTENYCNMDGCGIKKIPRDQRGSYCYACDTVTDPNACEKLAVCPTDEICMLYIAPEFMGLPDKIYRSQCGKQEICEQLLAQSGSNNCSGTCCSDDFCNNKCSYTNFTFTTPTTKQNSVTTSPFNISTDLRPTHPSTDSIISTSRSSITTAKPFHCQETGGYREFRRNSTRLCVHIFGHSEHNWKDARRRCQSDNADLVVLDTLEKAQLLRTTLIERNIHTYYWIGMRDTFLNDTYYWVDGSLLDKSQSDWCRGEPDMGSDNCVFTKYVENPSQNFKWHDSGCGTQRKYICEKK